MTGKCGFGLGLTAKTVIITSLVTVVALGTTMLTGQAFTRLHGQVESILDSQLEQLMTSVRLMQQTESLISLGLIFSQAETHHDRRATLIELNDRLRWIHKLGADLGGAPGNEVIEQIESLHNRLHTNTTTLNRLLRKHIDGLASPDELETIRRLSHENRERAGEMSVLIGYFAASIRHDLARQSSRLSRDSTEQQRNLVRLSLLLLAVVLSAGVFFAYHVVGRIKRLQQAVNNPMVSPESLRVGGHDEITALSETLRGYVQRIQAQEAHMRGIHEELAFLAEHDPLTSLANRRHFDAAAHRLLKLGPRALCLAVIDIDHFKSVNDLYGHDVGDRALRHVAQLLAGSLRENDLLARFGGEEFVAMVSVRSTQAAGQLFDNVRQHVMDTPFMDNGRTVGLTVSIGLAMAYPGGEEEQGERHSEPASTAEALLQAALREADRALYEAKRGGRNRVCMAPQMRDDDHRHDLSNGAFKDA